MSSSSPRSTSTPPRVVADEEQIKVDGDKKWLYAAIDTESKLLLEVDVYSRRATVPATAFRNRPIEKHDVDDAGVDEPVEVAVGRFLRKLEVVYDVLDGGLILPSEVGVQLGELWVRQQVRDREEAPNDVAVGAM